MTDELTPTQKKMLLVLSKREYGITAALAGNEVWGDENAMGSSTCPYARIAGKVLKRLSEKHLCWTDTDLCYPLTMHRITGRGIDLVNLWKDSDGKP